MHAASLSVLLMHIHAYITKVSHHTLYHTQTKTHHTEAGRKETGPPVAVEDVKLGNGEDDESSDDEMQERLKRSINLVSHSIFYKSYILVLVVLEM
jgi:hypothetical protein